MALVPCKNCGKEVSDKAVVCPNCGQVLDNDKDTINTATQQNYICEECGTEFSKELKNCPNCGCPVSENATPQKVEIAAVNLPKIQKKQKKYLAIAIVSIISLILIALISSNISKQDYINKLEETTTTMLIGAANAEDAGNLIKSVWYNCIYEELDTKTDKYTRYNGRSFFYDDFNTALYNLFSDSDFKDTISSIESNQETVANMMKELKEPPSKYEDAYRAIKETHTAYLELTNLAIDPTGSLQTYSNNFINADSNFIKCYDAMELYFD